jgi:hypothetical protein
MNFTEQKPDWASATLQGVLDPLKIGKGSIPSIPKVQKFPTYCCSIIQTDAVDCFFE